MVENLFYEIRNWVVVKFNVPSTFRVEAAIQELVKAIEAARANEDAL